MRRLIAIAAATLALLAGIGTVLLLSQRQERASPSPTGELLESTSNSSLGTRAWPTYGGSNARDHRAPKTLRPPYRRLWSVYGDSSFIEFPPVFVGEQLFSRPTGARGCALYTHRASCGSGSSVIAWPLRPRSPERRSSSRRWDPALRSRTGRGRRRRPERRSTSLALPRRTDRIVPARRRRPRDRRRP